MRNDKKSIKCVILTLKKQNVMIPDALVAEVISVKDIQSGEDKPGWYIGDMKWRGVDVPLLSFEACGGEKISRVNLNTQAVVLFAVGKSGEVSKSPYVALVMSGVPHVSSFSHDQIRADDDSSEAHPMVAQKARINGASVSILDVDAMVAMLEELAA
ncbi:MAG: chemotaxis protein CheW [Gammaproteobacteria bacterium]|nr:chemotaxis protein CheW [Gammaproteobacteria bacterium]